MAADIGATLFVDLLGMTGYPGSPFTGNIYRDLVMFLIVPTIFIIFVLYIATGRIIPDKKMRIMVGHFRRGGGGGGGPFSSHHSSGGGFTQGADRKYKALPIPVMDPGRRSWLNKQIQRKTKEIEEKEKS